VRLKRRRERGSCYSNDLADLRDFGLISRLKKVCYLSDLSLLKIQHLFSTWGKYLGWGVKGYGGMLFYARWRRGGKVGDGKSLYDG